MGLYICSVWSILYKELQYFEAAKQIIQMLFQSDTHIHRKFLGTVGFPNQ